MADVSMSERDPRVFCSVKACVFPATSGNTCRFHSRTITDSLEGNYTREFFPSGFNIRYSSGLMGDMLRAGKPHSKPIVRADRTVILQLGDMQYKFIVRNGAPVEVFTHKWAANATVVRRVDDE